MIIPALVLLVTAPSDFQQAALHMRFTPRDGMRVTRAFQYSAELRVDSAGQTRSESTVADGHMHQVVVPGRRGETVLHLALDSLRVRHGSDDAPWSLGGADRSGSTWRQIAIDERLQAGEARLGGAGPVAALLEWAAFGLPGFSLPRDPVSVGDEWRTWVRVPRGRLTLPAGVWLDLDVRVAVRVDDIAVTGRDTLFTMTVTGEGWDTRGRRIAPTRLGVAASLVWSSGWGTFVSQAVRIAIVSEGRAPNNEPVHAALDVLMRSSIRPAS